MPDASGFRDGMADMASPVMRYMSTVDDGVQLNLQQPSLAAYSSSSSIGQLHHQPQLDQHAQHPLSLGMNSFSGRSMQEQLQLPASTDACLMLASLQLDPADTLSTCRSAADRMQHLSGSCMEQVQLAASTPAAHGALFGGLQLEPAGSVAGQSATALARFKSGSFSAGMQHDSMQAQQQQPGPTAHAYAGLDAADLLCIDSAGALAELSGGWADAMPGSRLDQSNGISYEVVTGSGSFAVGSSSLAVGSSSSMAATPAQQLQQLMEQYGDGISGRGGSGAFAAASAGPVNGSMHAVSLSGSAAAGRGFGSAAHTVEDDVTAAADAARDAAVLAKMRQLRTLQQMQKQLQEELLQMLQ